MTPQDQEHLRLLTIFHYVIGGLTALLSLIPLIHVGLGVAMLTGVFPTGPSSAGAPPPAFLGWLFLILGATIVLLGETTAILTLLAGRFLSQRRRRLFCLITAGVNCLQIPIGLCLGVFTFLVLMRPSVKAAFDASPQTAEHP
jgi:hypothetical protein